MSSHRNVEPLVLPCPHCGAGNRVPADRLDQRPNCGRCHLPLFGGHPLALDEAGFTRHAAAALPLLVDFWAPWCGPCRAMAPAFERAAAALEPGFRVAKVDTQDHPGLAQRFDIRSIPTLVVFQSGRELARRSGALPESEIVRFAQSAIGSR